MDEPGSRQDAPAGASTADPVIEAYKRHVDRTLLLENLKKTPHERVLALIALQKVAREARKAGKRVLGY